MKKKFLSLALALCMVMTLLPVTAQAEAPEMHVGNTDVSTESSTPVYWKAAEEGSAEAYVSTGTADDYLFSVALNSANGTYTLTLNGVDITSDQNYCGIYTGSALNIIIADGKSNTITVPGVDHTYYGIKAGDINISGGGTLVVTVNSDAKSHVKFGIFSNQGVTFSGGYVSVAKYGKYGDAVHAVSDIRILGDANVTLVDWSTGEGVDCGLHSDKGNVAIGGSASVDICSQSKGIYADNDAYIGYVWDAAVNDGTGGYVESGNPTVKINDAEKISAISTAAGLTFNAGEMGIYGRNTVYIAGGEVSAAGEISIYGEASGVTISGSDTEVATSALGGGDETYYQGICSGNGITITDATVVVSQSKPLGCGLFADGYIRISGTAKVSVVGWGADKACFGIAALTNYYSKGEFAIGGSAQLNVCSQLVGICADESAYIGYVWDAAANSGTGGYVKDGNPTVKINDAAAVASITPDTTGDFTPGLAGLAAADTLFMTGGRLETTGKNYALVSINNGISSPSTILAAQYGDPAIDATDLNQVTWVNEESIGTYKYNTTDTVTYIKIGTLSDITKREAMGGSYTVKVNGAEAASAEAGDTVTLSATPDSGYSLSSWNVYQTGEDTSVKVTVTDNVFIMPAYPVTVEAVFSANATPTYALTVTAGAGGSAAGGGNYEAVSITATPDSGYQFTQWTISSGTGIFGNASSSATTFTMGAGAATIRAAFTPIGGGPVGVSAPNVSTTGISDVTMSGATLTGRVSSTDGGVVKARGFVIGTTPRPVLGAEGVINIPVSGSAGSFTATADSLLPATTYHVRAYAVNSAGISYGEDIPLATGYVGDGKIAIPKTGNGDGFPLRVGLLALGALGGCLLPLTRKKKRP